MAGCEDNKRGPGQARERGSDQEHVVKLDDEARWLAAWSALRVNLRALERRRRDDRGRCHRLGACREHHRTRRRGSGAVQADGRHPHEEI